MKKLILILTILVTYTGNSQDIDHSLWTTFLQKYVSESGNVNYAAVAKNQRELKDYLNEFIRVSPKENWTKNEKLAYWINAYNAFTIKLIVDRYPLESIRDISSPWDIDFIPIDGDLISLNHIEHSILRDMNEPRIHFAINCASISCPKLITKAYLSDTLEEQLTEVTRNFFKSNKNIIEENHIQVSRIFKWFTRDFKINGSIIPFINQYTDVNINPDAEVSYLDYNWNLNE